VSQFKQIFIGKFSDDIENIRAVLIEPVLSPDGLRNLIRIIHNIKSDAAMVGLPSVSTTAEKAENLLTAYVSAESQPRGTRQLLDRLLTWLQAIRDDLLLGKDGMEIASDLIRGMEDETGRLRANHDETGGDPLGFQGSSDC
jgi:chemotaxis protein histidine kinase CheA